MKVREHQDAKGKDGKLPNSWAWSYVGDVTLPVEKVDPSLRPDCEIKYVDISSIDNNVNRVINAKSYLGKEAPSRARQLVVKDDILFSTVRTYLKNIAQVPEKYNNQIASTGFSVLRPAKGIKPNYLFFYSLSKSFLDKIEGFQRGTSYPAVRDKDVRIQAIPIPPQEEQHRIVSKLEELFSELDKGIEFFKIAREQLKVYRQAVLKHAFEGKLTEGWRKKHPDELEPGETLLKKIKAEREQRYQQQLDEWKQAFKAWEAEGQNGKKPSKPGKLEELPPLTEGELAELPELPEGWGWAHLSKISENIQIGPFGSLLHKADYISNGTPLVNPSHIKDQKIEPDWNFSVSEKKLKSLRNYVMNENDIVMGRRGEMGRCAVVSEKENGWLCGTGSLFVRLLPSAHSDFYCNVLSSRRTKDFLSGNSIGTTMQNLNQKILHNVPVPLCNLKEQKQVIQQIEARLSVLEKLEQDIENGLKQAETLRQSLLKEAFEGRLAAQDPNDEPASVLLARIKTEKAEQEKKIREEKKVAV